MDTRDRKLKITPKMRCHEGWTFTALSDSDFAGDVQSRKSVTGYLIYFMGALVAWKSKSQTCVALSSTEAEYSAATEAAKEILFLTQLVESLDLEVKKPIKLFVDNKGAMFLAKNRQSSMISKHIDVKHHFIRDMVEKQMFKIELIGTNDNTSDIMTKNATVATYERHAKTFFQE